MAVKLTADWGWKGMGLERSEPIRDRPPLLGRPHLPACHSLDAVDGCQHTGGPWLTPLTKRSGQLVLRDVMARLSPTSSSMRGHS